MKIFENKDYNFKKITPENGMVLTFWDKKEIKDYSSSTLMYTPFDYDASNLYEITVEEDEKYKQEQQKAYQEEI